MKKKPTNDKPTYLDWRKSGKHLPPFLRDFHDQKNVFKAITEIYGENTDAMTPTEKSEYEFYHVGWMSAHVYTIDFFLWFMAAHGWTLQRSRNPLFFEDLSSTLADLEKKRAESFKTMLAERAKEAEVQP